MGISIFPSTAAEFVSNNFVIDMNDTTNNTADTGGVKQAGPYSMSFSSGDTSFDVYLIDNDGNSVGYSNNTSIVASGLFSSVVILGVATDEIITFNYSGSVNNADGEGDEPGAGAYLESISPADLPNIDDTATVIGGNFGADTEITFESGATVLPAKSITVVSGTELLVTRPDGLIEDDSPYTLRAVTTGVPQPTGTNANILTDAVTAGSDPTWVTTSPLNPADVGSSFSQTLEATDSDGTIADYSVTAGTITPGLSLDSSTGVLSGTPTTGGNFTFTVTATDDGGNTTPKEFEQSIAVATGGTITDDGGIRTHTFTSTDDFEVFTTISNAEFELIAGGGGGGDVGSAGGVAMNAGGGGAGGLVIGTAATLTAGTTTITVGAGGGVASNGNNSSFPSFGTATGGGAGGSFGDLNGKNGGSGGGGASDDIDSIFGSGGTATAGQGNDGQSAINNLAGGGGGAGNTASEPADGGSGVNGNAGGGGGGQFSGPPSIGPDGGGNGGNVTSPAPNAPTPGEANTGGGGGGGVRNTFSPFTAQSENGGSGIVIVRYAF